MVSWINNKKTQKIDVVNEMMSISCQLTKKILNINDTVIKNVLPELIPVGKGIHVNNKYIPYDKNTDITQRKFITLNEIITNGLPEKEYRITSVNTSLSRICLINVSPNSSPSLKSTTIKSNLSKGSCLLNSAVEWIA